jgi:hypothetical protein
LARARVPFLYAIRLELVRAYVEHTGCHHRHHWLPDDIVVFVVIVIIIAVVQLERRTHFDVWCRRRRIRQFCTTSGSTEWESSFGRRYGYGYGYGYGFGLDNRGYAAGTTVARKSLRSFFHRRRWRSILLSFEFAVTVFPTA